MKKRKIYLASSWRNIHQPATVHMLRQAGHEVYDFREPKPGDDGFHWTTIDGGYRDWDARRFRLGLSHPIAEHGFNLDWSAMQWADTGVLLLPCGRSAHLEAGYFTGAGKDLFILLLDFDTPELMYKMATGIAVDLNEMVEMLA